MNWSWRGDDGPAVLQVGSLCERGGAGVAIGAGGCGLGRCRGELPSRFHMEG